MKAKNHKLSGERCGAMTVIGKVGSENGAILLCKCDCGNQFRRSAGAISRGIKHGKTQSCGCSKELREILETGGRTCPRCETHKLKSEFSTSKTTRHGLQIYCRDCYRNWRDENKDDLRLRKRKYYQENRDSIDAKKKEYTKANRSRLNTYWTFAGAQRRAIQKAATPSWADNDAVMQIYKHASLLNCWPGERTHVDHIVPLQSAIVCGLHWEGNLQLLSLSENSSKGNFYWPDMPEVTNA